ncbi:hypothetical protein [Demequina sp. NBRC 110056]|uniref:hypothetical protein n=1 Tax=Demequina sp. NBRC 110056 TaxID=1570345 RepID=UPI00117F83D4|nr:hypothetical protein [Demequina sp. NBRC 110056]
MTSSRWTAPLLAALLLAGCTGDADGDQPATSEGTMAPATTESESTGSGASIDVDSGGDPTADAQDAGGAASLGTAAATVTVVLPDGWQYEGTYGDGTVPYAVLVDASQPFDLSEPGSEAYRDSVWVQVETYRIGAESPWGTMPEDPAELAATAAERRDGDATVVDGRGVALVHLVAEDDDGRRVDELFARHGDLWILARPSNVDVEGYVDGEDVPILVALLDESEIA